MTGSARELLRAELETSRTEFQELLASIGDRSWTVRSLNRGWTNGELLFHIALGYFLLTPLVVVMNLFGVLPRGCSRVFAALLNLSTPLFNWINGLGPRVGARILNARRLSRTFDRVHSSILRRLDSTGPQAWSRGMHYPRRWDPRFREFMTMEDVFHYPTIHFHHHRSQIRTEDPS
ncbi:MAG TPA: DinB family protein [Tepidiformaceae bacterium]|nr:DinB family protein [Tepidiformaceae bacterium]